MQIFDEEEETKRGKKRWTRQKLPAEDLANALTEIHKCKPSPLNIPERELVSELGSLFLASRKELGRFPAVELRMASPEART